MKRKALNLGRRFLKHELIRGSIYLFVGFIATGFFSFILNLFFARNMTASDYGIYASLLSVLALLGISAQSLTPVIIRFAADYFAKNQLAQARCLYFKMTKMILGLSAILFFASVIFAIPIINFLHIDNVFYVVFIGLIVFAQYINIVNGAFLQSLLKFSVAALLTSFGGIVKIIAGITLILLGFRVFGALWAIFLSFLVPFALGFLPLRFILAKRDNVSVSISTKEILGYAIPTSIAIFSVISLISTDVILVKHFFNAKEAGLYGGLSLVGKVIFYFTGVIPTVMFPLLIKRHAKNQRFNTLFYLALLLVALPSFAISFFYYLFPVFSINFFLGGGDYLKIAPYLGVFGVFIAIFSMLNLCINFFLSLRKTNISFLVLGGAVLQVILISLFHSNFYQIILSSLSVSGLLLFILLVYYVKEYENLEFIGDLIAFMNNPRT